MDVLLPEAFIKTHLEMLRDFADGGRGDVREPEKIETAVWLYEQGYITGSLHRPLSGRSLLLNVRITALGLQKLSDEESRMQQTREVAYIKKHPMRAQLVIVVAAALTVAAILAYFNHISSK